LKVIRQFFVAAAATMAADWEPRTRSGEVDGTILEAIERWAARWQMRVTPR